MSTFVVTPEKLSEILREQAREFPQAVRKGMVAAARRGQAHMPKKTPTDMGQLRNSWRLRQVPDVALMNDAPHAGIVELGARPHKVSDAGMLALEEWALRHAEVIAAFQDDGKGRMRTREEAARAAAHAIAWKIRHEGQKPTYFLRNELERLTSFVPAEIAREMAKAIAESSK